MGLWQRMFGEPSLATIATPTKVKLTGRITSPNDALGLMTGLRAAVVELQLSARYVRQTRDAHGPGREEEVFEILGTHLTTQPLVVQCEGGELIVPTDGITLRFAGNDHGVPVDRPLPPEVASLLASAGASARVVYYRELALSQGDKVSIEATVAPAPGLESDGYRGTTTRGWIARVDLGPVLVIDRSLDEP